ncbi:hypothetical protein [Mucilaginibacter myungsuensis]|jgi:hypothetical protein|uniref:Uncharacterized protein n=1 Tax=Mucilaginibacter myungsuensis TaxID=649104 RepID=A0A929PWM5_9SPHI|nr:hypothetical protein [Mucilaginibacter myungsuensis]MBE9662988.1 hypothetical protein [Mucilaginibacter myungsuensis]MDN3598617.1 hypothetical protein [Mucilaginibacter myungsuensis]
MEDKIFLLVKVTIKTTHPDIHDAIAELQNSDVIITSTDNVRVLRTEIIPMNTRNAKN